MTITEPKIILVVCSGNIHRSVIAEYCINQALKKNGLDKEFIAVSRGIQTASPPVGKNLKDYRDEWLASSPILQEIGIGISDARSTPVDLSIVEKASLILAMDRSVLVDKPNSLTKQFPAQGYKTWLFRELEGKTGDVPDCFGSNDSNLHRRVIELIENISRENLGTLLHWMES